MKNKTARKHRKHRGGSSPHMTIAEELQKRCTKREPEKTKPRNGMNPCPLCKSSSDVMHFEKNEREAEIKCTTCKVSVTATSDTRVTINGATMWLINYDGLRDTWNKLNPTNND